MGLAGPKKRTKIAHDPNNNNWAKSTDSFGHKILASQGWKPGDTLGARDANHATHYTAGSNSHIRVLLKDDNLGLGAARGGNSAETFGLSLYSGLLGRLNGKTDAQVEKEQGAQRDVELAVYQGRKYGHINFISAGFLVGDKIELKSTDLSTLKPATKEAAPPATSSKKRKRSGPKTATTDSSSASDSSDSSEDEAEEVSRSSKKNKDSKKKKKSSKESSSESTDESKSKDKKRKIEKKEKKRKTADATSSEDETRAEKKARKAERRAKKEEKKRRKEEKKASASATPSTTPGTPAEPAQQAIPALFGRQAVRQRYIAQKRLAHLNPQALKEIFMVKA